ncbi:MAG: hypothetical protein HS126_33470 [Anaerolineales bacterium]|nr:hypothetical protein [Anaerolineales bacterium]
MTDPIDTSYVTTLTDDEMLDILRQVQSGELSVEQAERLLGATHHGHEDQAPSDTGLAGQTFSAPLGKTANGKLVFERGAAGLYLHGEALSGQLFTARFERHVPVVRVNGGTVTVRYRDFGFGLLNWLRYGFNPPQSEMTLNADIPWQLDIHSGIAQSCLDLRSIRLRKLTIHNGVSDVKLILGEPNDIVRLDCHGGVHNLIVLRPAPVAVQLTVHGGATSLGLDNQKLGAIGGITTLETANIKTALCRYVINVHGGANNFKVGAL